MSFFTIHSSLFIYLDYSGTSKKTKESRIQVDRRNNKEFCGNGRPVDCKSNGIMGQL